MLKQPSLIEKAFAVFSLFLSTTALIPVLLDKPGADAVPADPYSPLLFIGVYLVTILLLVLHRNSFIWVVQKDIWIWLLVGLVLASVLWTVAPDLTPRRSLLLLGTTLFGVYLAMRYTLREQLQFLALAFGAIIILSILFAIALPFYGVMSYQEGGIHAGAWRGIMTHKNILGRMMSLSGLVFLFVALANPISNRRYRWIPWAGFILSIVLIILSTSKTSLIVFLTLMTVMHLYRSLRSNFTKLIPLCIAFILVGGVAATLLLDNLDVIAGSLGRDLTLTGRTDIWSAMLEIIAERPWFGYGFNAVWRDWNHDVTAYLWRTLEWECPYGHNGLMDLWAELGMSGLAVFLLSLGTVLLRGIAFLRVTKTVEGLWSLMYLTYLLIYNVSESTLVSSNSIFWVLYVSTIFSVAIEYEQAKMYSYANAMLEE
jgi:exopolysaccharide production protein ExoQ